MTLVEFSRLLICQTYCFLLIKVFIQVGIELIEKYSYLRLHKDLIVTVLLKNGTVSPNYMIYINYEKRRLTSL